MVAAVGLVLVGALVATCVQELVGLLVEQRVDGLLDGLLDELPDVTLYRLIVERYEAGSQTRFPVSASM